ncbi:alpha/beta hydrolase [Kibdelosporangium phytohabitans]|uniref:Peptidase S33 tripeptidyl aminopeptidase-like C-terminal domain-containing protein n=1 Tax=Kibdelosporangium phytohabitans TaxID=860235 RepID=A0A0N9HZH5_9PSEU|nr:alpha/beta hydrolase [Kibdelosporangium phytohabitans]ALG07756.1 hypothetical protein AOZ06_13310 [Kibdelosporangium phytohabitans]
MLLTQNLRAALGSRARPVTADQAGHGTYLGTENECVDTIGTELLVNGKLPATDVQCGPAAGTSAEAAGKPRQRQLPF